jgi:hypothetical protein
LLDQLLTHFRSTQARVQALRPERRIGLALTIYDCTNVSQQVWQMFFAFLASALVIAVNITEFALQFFQCFAQGLAVPAQFRVPSGRGMAWLSAKHCLDDLSHKMPPLIPA